jgi:rubrerythrin
VAIERVELRTFGGVLRFAMELEASAEELYKNLVSRIGDEDPVTTELFTKYSREHSRRHRLLEEIRQRNINEVLLEPISGIESGTYTVNTDTSGKTDSVKIINTAADAEEKTASFYADTYKVGRAALGEAAIAFKRFHHENRERERALRSMGCNERST